MKRVSFSVSVRFPSAGHQSLCFQGYKYFVPCDRKEFLLAFNGRKHVFMSSAALRTSKRRLAWYALTESVKKQQKFTKVLLVATILRFCRVLLYKRTR